MESYSLVHRSYVKIYIYILIIIFILMYNLLNILAADCRVVIDVLRITCIA